MIDTKPLKTRKDIETAAEALKARAAELEREERASRRATLGLGDLDWDAVLDPAGNVEFSHETNPITVPTVDPSTGVSPGNQEVSRGRTRITFDESNPVGGTQVIVRTQNGMTAVPLSAMRRFIQAFDGRAAKSKK